MAVAFYYEYPQLTPAKYEELMRELDRELGLNGAAVPGNRFHFASALDGGIRAVDVFESPEIAERFARERLLPIAARIGVTLGPPKEAWPVLHWRRGRD